MRKRAAIANSGVASWYLCDPECRCLGYLTLVSDRIVSTTAGVLVGRKEELFCLETALSLERSFDWRMPVRYMGFAF